MVIGEVLQERFSELVYDGEQVHSVRHRAGTPEALLNAPKWVESHQYLVRVRVRHLGITEVRTISVSAPSARGARRKVASEMGLSIVGFISVKREKCEL